MKPLVKILILLCTFSPNAFAQVKPLGDLQNNFINEVAFKNDDKEVIDKQNLGISEKRILAFDNQPNIILENIKTVIVTNFSLEKNLELPANFNVFVTRGFEQKQPIVYAEFPRYIKNAAGKIEKLIDYKLTVINGPLIKKVRGNRVYASNSLLASGTWHKIGLEERGVYVIDYNFVKDIIGINPSSINPSLIKIAGNGGQMVAEDNAIIRADDVVENPIQLIGMQDGTFDVGDYLLFYAQGPFNIIKDSVLKTFTQQINLYSNKSFYFISFEGSVGKRITTLSNTATPNKIVNSFNDFAWWHKDSFYVTNFGKQWFGQSFGNKLGSELSRTYNFNFPNIDIATPVQVKTNLAAISYFGNNQFNLKVNNVSLANATISSTGTEYYELAYKEAQFLQSITSNTDNIAVQLNYTPANDFAIGYVDFIEVNARRNLVFNGSKIVFTDFNSVAPGAVAEFQLSNANANIEIWDITNQLNPIKMSTSLNGTILSFTNSAAQVHQYIAFQSNNFQVPSLEQRNVPNQNLHSLGNVDYIIVSHPSFINQANDLALHHQSKHGLKTVVVTTQQVYNEFGSGAQDISAIRDFTKMFYDRAISLNDIPKSILLFGDASYDYKDRIANNSNFVPIRETDETASRINGYCSDDFFGILDDNEHINNTSIANTLDIGVGRLPINNLAEANAVVNKVKMYDSSASYGAWKNDLVFTADNKDGSVHATDAEIMSKIAQDSVPQYNKYKIYVDAFPIFPTAAGDRAPQAAQSMNEIMFNGALVINYNGHGGPSAWCEERIFTAADIPTYININRLPLFITATCDFAPFDNPTISSAGEKLVTFAKGGAIALMTTTQLVFQYENRKINSDYWKSGFKPMANGKMPNLGDAMRMCKNATYANQFGDLGNYRKFALLGDPGLSLAFPKLSVVADSINGRDMSIYTDTLKALNNYTLKGRITDKQGNLVNGFNGVVEVSIFDKVKNTKTLGQSPSSPILNYTLQNTVLFKGKATVTNGLWSITFIVPKDIDYNYGFGKISLYAYSNNTDANGLDTRILVGGLGNANIVDNDGPIIKPFINNTNFLNGGICSKNGILIVKLSDENGINTSGSSIGHDITAILDNNAQAPIVLNNFYEGEKDNYKAGTVNYPFRNLSLGQHTLQIKAWDVLNNSNTANIDFVVVDDASAKMERVFNYPNPFTTKTNFCFEHNFPNETLFVTVQVYAISGQMIKAIHKVVNSESSRINDIEWDGKDEIGDEIGKGVYMYKVYYKTQSGISVSKYQKLIKL